MIKPMKTLELHYPMIQFLIISDIPQFKLGNIRSRDALRPIACERKDLMDYKVPYYILPGRYMIDHDQTVCIRSIRTCDRVTRLFDCLLFANLSF